MVKLIDSALQRRMAYEVLEGFGDVSRGEWTDDRPLAFHLRRRLNEQEEVRIGQALDCRSTEEARKRYEAAKDFLPEQALALARMEIPDTIFAIDFPQIWRTDVELCGAAFSGIVGFLNI